MSDVKIECKLVIEAKIYKIPYDNRSTKFEEFCETHNIDPLSGDPETSRRGWCEWMNAYVGTAEQNIWSTCWTDGDNAFFGYREQLINMGVPRATLDALNKATKYVEELSIVRYKDCRLHAYKTTYVRPERHVEEIPSIRMPQRDGG